MSIYEPGDVLPLLPYRRPAQSTPTYYKPPSPSCGCGKGSSSPRRRRGWRRRCGGAPHDVLPRALAFYHHWGKQHGTIVEETENLFFAGKETMTSLLTWATVALAMHPEWQDRARREVVVVRGRRSLPTKDHITKLKTVGMIVNETLRLYPPAVAMIRKAKQDVELGGGHAWGGDATEFNPARFADEGQEGEPGAAFMPFGGGARACIGQNLALMEAKVALAVVLLRFELRLSPAYVHAPRVLMILHPQHGAPVMFRPLL
ncbi:hypothetical protein SETIT_8G205300v2 [Setaria italica]|uniref:Cytochrome P450 n=1 Tax=Setaria italica TaxID=4555 RepID=A0A368SA30_SETIT|nr:hypothetical protein SETIT_8G205300v2 [Setaria italica]